MKKLFFWICLLSFSFFASDAMANLSGNESAIAESAKIAKVKENHPRPFKGNTIYPIISMPGYGYGHATHLGIYTSHYSIDGVTGIETMCAADGSELNWTWTWEPPYDTGTWEITGGTGRFANATGSGDWSGYFTPDYSYLIIHYTGTIHIKK